ncbi:MAG: methionyl-tRNA formyltransferase [Anaerovoracaceae bacterium]
MKIVYMGTPDFAVPALQKLVEAGQEVGYVVTQPDAAKDRGKKLKPTPVKEKATELGIEVLQPERIKGNDEFYNLLKAYEPDLIVVAAYGKILPKEILEIPPKGCINIHGSILPRWRGAAPIQRSIIAGDKLTGITLMLMEEGLDTGDILAVATTEIGKKTAGDLHDELSILGGDLLVDKLEAIEDGSITPEKQEDNLAVYAEMIFKKDGEIDFTKSAEEIERRIRGFAPWPGSYTNYDGKVFKIWEADVEEGTVKEKPGTISRISEDGIYIATSKNYLVAKIIQMQGKKRMTVKDFLRGNNIEILSVLG